MFAQAGAAFAQDAAAPAGDAAPAVEAPAADADAAPTTTQAPTNRRSGGFWSVVFGSGWLGVVLWIGLFATAGAGVYFIVDSSITIRATKVIPQSLVDNVTSAMKEGDVLKALKNCESDPSPMANILTAGFSHVEEGFEVIQEAVATAADLETERMIQKLTWVSVMANISPMLGLLGTVQGMIGAFGTIAMGAPDVNLLAMNIGQALWTTAAGLAVAVPCVTIFYALRNRSNTLTLRMEAMTMELIKDLRNVEVVAE
jgi:biopolymer transport protein ExbB